MAIELPLILRSGEALVLDQLEAFHADLHAGTGADDALWPDVSRILLVQNALRIEPTPWTRVVIQEAARVALHLLGHMLRHQRVREADALYAALRGAVASDSSPLLAAEVKS